MKTKSYDSHARVQIDLTSDDPDIPSRTILYPRLAFGPCIIFAGAKTTRDTELVIGHDEEVLYDTELPSGIRLKPESGRHFLYLNLYALLKPCNDDGVMSFDVQHECVNKVQCDLDGPHPGHLVDENGIWTLTNGRLWCRGKGDIA